LRSFKKVFSIIEKKVDITRFNIATNAIIAIKKLKKNKDLISVVFYLVLKDKID